MKKFFTIIAVVFYTMPLFSQTNTVQLYVCAPEQTESVPESSMDYLINTLCTVVTSSGLSAQSDYLTQFLLIPKVNVATRNVIANAQQQVALTLDVTLQIVDNLSCAIYASTTINIKGVGTNETKAFNSAFRTINKENQQIKSLINSGKKKMLDFYEAETENIIKKANLLAVQGNYDEAFYLLSMIPSQCSKYDLCISAGLSIWKEYKDYSYSKNLAKAESIWVAGQNYDAANMAGLFLANILPDANCYGDAQRLYKEIKSKIGDLWTFEMKQYDTEASLRKAKIESIQAIGVAYGKGQQPNAVIHYSRTGNL